MAPGAASAAGQGGLPAAVAALQAGRPAEVLALLRDAPDGADSRHLHALAQWDLGERQPAVTALQALAAAAPDRADIHRNLARMLALLHRPQDAIPSLQRVLALETPSVETRRALADALSRCYRHAEAEAQLTLALREAPGDPGLRASRAQLYRATGRMAQALADIEAGLALDPGHKDLLLAKGCTLLTQGDYLPGIAVFDRMLALDPADAGARHNRSVGLLTLGELAAGFADYECRAAGLFNSVEAAGPAETALRKGEDPHGLRLLLRYEQGMGDTLQFCRYAPLLAAAGAAVTLLAQRPVAPLLRRSLDLPVVTIDDPVPAHDRHALLLSLPHVCGTTLSSIPAPGPYLRADPVRRAAWARRLHQAALPGRRQVGFLWAGHAGHRNDANRSIPLAQFQALMRLPGIQPVSLARDLRDGDAALLQAIPGLIDAGPELQDFDDTAALLANLDLLVSVDTGPVHLAGGLGRRCWVLLPAVPDWRWMLGRSDSPWYPGLLRLFRQPATGDWQPALAQVAAALAGHS